MGYQTIIIMMGTIKKASNLYNDGDNKKFSNLIAYGKLPKSLYTKVSDKMTYANNANPDQTSS